MDLAIATKGMTTLVSLPVMITHAMVIVTMVDVTGQYWFEWLLVWCRWQHR